MSFLNILKSGTKNIHTSARDNGQGKPITDISIMESDIYENRNLMDSMVSTTIPAGGHIQTEFYLTSNFCETMCLTSLSAETPHEVYIVLSADKANEGVPLLASNKMNGKDNYGSFKGLANGYYAFRIENNGDTSVELTGLLERRYKKLT